MITKRSNHIPMFTNMEMKNVANKLVRNLCDQNNCGVITFQVIMLQ